MTQFNRKRIYICTRMYRVAPAKYVCRRFLNYSHITGFPHVQISTGATWIAIDSHVGYWGLTSRLAHVKPIIVAHSCATAARACWTHTRSLPPPQGILIHNPRWCVKHIQRPPLSTIITKFVHNTNHTQSFPLVNFSSD
jgi:hypothetical protein